MPTVDLSWIVGQGVEAISLTEPVSWWFKFSGGTSLRADTLWRVVSSERIEVTSQDHRHRFGLPEPVDAGGRAMQVLGRAKVCRVSLVKSTGDVAIGFDSGATLEVLTTSLGYEGWSIAAAGRGEIIGLILGGGEIEVRPPA